VKEEGEAREEEKMARVLARVLARVVRIVLRVLARVVRIVLRVLARVVVRSGELCKRFLYIIIAY